MRTRLIYPASVSLACLFMLTGCGPSGPTVVPVKGEVIYKGAPLKNVPQGLVHYIPSTREGRQASGRIQPDGTFVLTTFKKADGVVPGEYNITVSAYTTQPELTRQQVEASGGVGIAGPKLLIPEKYTEPSTSGLSDIVDTRHSGFKRIELTDERVQVSGKGASQ